jgi:bifunctional N-acetylglucosamine-1-phosphate-uridyltransferase/glucosamine-1-phosphate-acetyltransferase GlmU-like protein
MLGTYSEAIATAQNYMNADNSQEEYYIVEVVAHVKKKIIETPIEIIEIRK